MFRQTLPATQRYWIKNPDHDGEIIMRICFAIIFIFVLLVQGIKLWAQRPDMPAAGLEPVYQDGGKRDPFVPLVDVDGNIVLYDNELILSDLSLEGIMLSSRAEDSVVIINGKIFKVRNKIGAFQIENILKDRVILQKGRETFELKLKKE